MRALSARAVLDSNHRLLLAASGSGTAELPVNVAILTH